MQNSTMASRNHLEKQNSCEKIEKKEIRCTVCGAVFEKGANSACSRCPFHKKNCGFVKCPNCGFDIPTSSKIWDWIQNKLRGVSHE